MGGFGRWKEKLVFLMVTLMVVTAVDEKCEDLTLKCDTNFTEVKHSISTLMCPPGCLKQNLTLCGDRFYSWGSICLAAIHDQRVDDGGGPVVVYRSLKDGKKQYEAATRNAVTSKTCSSSGKFSYSFEMTCAVQGDSSTAVNDVVCPPGCGKEAVYGTEIYSARSSLCSAAIHAGMLTVKGGHVTFYNAKRSTSYNGSTSHGITSRDDDSFHKSFTFSNTKSCYVNRCENNSTCVEGIGGYFCNCPPYLTGKFCQKEVTCWDKNRTGIVELKAGKAVCQNGWLLFQKRFDGSENFQRNWKDYKDGFGNFSGEFWWGLKRVYHTIRRAKKKRCRLRIDLDDFQNETGYGEYRDFLVGPKCRYEVNLKGFSGNIGDSFSGSPISNTTKVNFIIPDKNQAEKLWSSKTCCSHDKRGGWWFRECFTQPNAVWADTETEKGIRWATWYDGARNLKRINFKFRCD